MTSEALQRGTAWADRARKLQLIGDTTHAGLCRYMQAHANSPCDFTRVFGELCQLNTAQIAAIQGDRQVLDQLPQFDHRRVILEELGRGSAGVVYQALDHLLDRVVAIKQVHPERTTADGMSLLRFEREAKIMASLEHPAIVTLHDVGLTKEGCPFMVLAYVPGPTLLEIIQHAREGHDLEEVLERGRLSQERVARQNPTPRTDEPYSLDVRRIAQWGERLAEGLAACHQRGILHRDVKPANILVNEAGAAKLTDFGIAFDPHQDRLTATGQLIGTPLYMPPEFLQGKRRGDTVSAACDLYALGVTLYEALVGRSPFHSNDPQELWGLIFKGEPTPLRALRADLPERLEEIVLRCMAKDPSARYTAAELASELGDFLAGKPSAAAPLESRPPRQSAGTALLVGLVVLGLVALVAVVALVAFVTS